MKMIKTNTTPKCQQADETKAIFFTLIKERMKRIKPV
jgi:hypothetical protein